MEHVARSSPFLRARASPAAGFACRAGRRTEEGLVMKKRLVIAVVLALIVLALCIAATPAVAITQGQFDGQGHPNVCAIVAEYEGQLTMIGSGTLIAPQVVVTASHVTAFIQTFSDDVYVSFAPVFDPADGSALIHGSMITNPGYNSRRANDSGDIAAVLLD